MMVVYDARSLGFDAIVNAIGISYTAHRFFSLIRET